ncbi:MAG: hypothetical protein ACMV1K_06805, partial [Sulfurospirillum sp.]
CRERGRCAFGNCQAIHSTTRHTSLKAKAFQPYIHSLKRSGFTVGFDNLRWFNVFPTALAPLLLLPFAYYHEQHYWEFSFLTYSP